MKCKDFAVKENIIAAWYISVHS